MPAFPFRDAVAVLAAAMCLAVLAASPARAQESGPSLPDSVTVQNVALPDNVGTDGAFTTFVPFDIPGFRGLEPALGLRYNSQWRGTGPDSYVAHGWRLAGLSAIEKRSVGGGTPHHERGRDVFLLDGVELLACADEAATNTERWEKWYPYPERYKTTIPNASCSAGGSMTTLRDDYRRIDFVGDASRGVAEFHVYDRDGTRYTYETVGAVAGFDPADPTFQNDPGRFRLVFQTRWLLTEIRDTQATPNVVTIAYEVSQSGMGYSTAPRHIAYGGYNIWLNYDWKPTHARTKYATGTQFLGIQWRRLRSVEVRDGDTPIRAYGLEYSQSAQTGTLLLTRVRQYGRDFEKQSNGPRITGGTQLPSWTFDYRGDHTAFTARTYGGRATASLAYAADINGDKRDELLFPPYRYEEYQTRCTPRGEDCREYLSVPYQSALDYRYSFGIDRSIARTRSGMARSESVRYSRSRGREGGSFHWWETRQTIGFSGPSLETGRVHQIYVASTTEDRDNHQTTEYTLEARELRPDGSGRTKGNASMRDCHSGAPRLLGNFDWDPESEVIDRRDAYQLDGSRLKRDWKLTNNASFCLDLANGALVADINGDGLDTILRRDTRWVYEVVDGRFTSRQLNRAPFFSDGGASFAIGDVNGDGAQDVVHHNPRSDDADGLSVQLSKGNGFANWDSNWGALLDLRINAREAVRRMQIADVNGDGFGDLILSTAQRTSALVEAPAPVRIFLSNGRQFIPIGGDNNWVPHFHGAGDFDGDGLVDAASGNPLRIYWNTGTVGPNLLRRMTDPQGLTTRIDYTPMGQHDMQAQNSADFPGNRMLVSRIERDGGAPHTARRIVDYSYTSFAYDHDYRKSLGFRTVTATFRGLDRPLNVVTTYEQGHWGLKGRVRSRTVVAGDLSSGTGTTWRQQINSWQATAAGALPMRAVRTREVVRERWGWGDDPFVSRRTDYVRDLYGMPTRIAQWGFAALDGTHEHDNRSTLRAYTRNLEKYIVDTPKIEIAGSWARPPSASPNDTRGWLSARFFTYDRALHAGGWGEYWKPPSRGNVTVVESWNGVADRPWRRVDALFSYDGHGNVTEERNGRGFVTRHSYDGDKHLFRTETINALGHVTRTAWDGRCQAPARTTDANGLITRFWYDVHCRERQRRLPNGQDIHTYYHGFGNPAAQHVRTTAETGFGGDAAWTIERAYFNGFGQVWKTTSGGATTADADDILTVRGFDARGNLAWESIPLTRAEGEAAAIPNRLRTRFTYDRLDRPQETLFADGNVRKTWRFISTFADLNGMRARRPEARSYNEDHFDGDGRDGSLATSTVYDAFGNVIRSGSWEYADGVGYEGGYGPFWATHYLYDDLDRLNTVTDPVGARWAYRYDVRGNRTRATDPALGIWTMAYDANGNLTRQTDAKGQDIAFDYDALDRAVRKHAGTGGARVTTHYRYDEPRDGYHNTGHLTRQEVRYPAGDGQPARSHVHELNYGTEGQLRWERHWIDDGVHPVRTHHVSRWYKLTGDLAGWCLPETPGSTSRTCRGGFHYDAARRLVAMDGLIDRVEYDATGYRTGTDYSNGARVTWQHDRRRGWLTQVDGFAAGSATPSNGVYYSRSASGRVMRQYAFHDASDYDFTYDHAGRLLRADNRHAHMGGFAGRAFRYDPAGNMTFHSRIGDYRYDTGRQRLTRAGDWAFQYDANGNTTRGLYGKAMTYDGENRPLSVTLNGVTTRYVYAADGSRLLRIDRAGTAQQTTTAYFGPMEIRNFGEGRNEEVVTYPHPEVRRVDGEPGILVHDQLGSVITLFNAEGERAINKHYRPYGQVSQWVTDPAAAAEDQGFVGQRHDAGAGLIYLNARYMDPELGRFIQPDWWDVRIAGTNRYAYSFNDPVNLADPGGNVPYNPGGDTSTGWSDRDNDGVEHYDSRRDRRSSDYLNQDGDGRHSIGIVGHDTDRNDYGGRSHIRGGVDSDSYESSRRGRYAENQWRALNNQAYATRMRALEMELAVGLASVVPVVRGARAGIMFVGTAARGWSLRWGMNVPRGWTRAPNRKGFGYRWSDPQNPGNGIRVDAANPSSPFASQRVPHVVVRSGGRIIGRDGQPLPGSLRQNPTQGHIPLSEYRGWTTWNSP